MGDNVIFKHLIGKLQAFDALSAMAEGAIGTFSRMGTICISPTIFIIGEWVNTFRITESRRSWRAAAGRLRIRAHTFDTALLIATCFSSLTVALCTTIFFIRVWINTCSIA